MSEIWMTRVENQQREMWQEQEKASQRQGDWNEVDGENQGVDSREKVKHIERNDLERAEI